MKPSFTTDVITFLLVLLFGYTASAKTFSQASFYADLLQVLPTKGAAVTAFLIPTLEAVVVLLLLFTRTRLLGLYLSGGLLGLFTVYIVYMLAALPHLPCSCGGVIGLLDWKEHVLFNCLFIGLTVFAVRSMKKQSKAAR